MRRVLTGIVVTALLIPPRPSASQGKVPVRSMSVTWVGHGPRVSFSARDFANREVVRKLKTGLPQRLVTRLYAYPENGKEPISVGALSCRVIYDLWEDVYRVRLQQDVGGRTMAVRNVQDVVHACLEADAMAFGREADFAKHRGARIYFAAIVELNPLSAGTVKRIRRWLARPAGEALEGDAFFGSFVSIFVTRRMGTAEKTLSFRSAGIDIPP